MRSPSATTSAWGPAGHQGRGAGGSLSGAMAPAGCSGGAGTSGVTSRCIPHRNPLILSGLYSRQRPERAVRRQISVSRSVSCSLRRLRVFREHSWSRPGITRTGCEKLSSKKAPSGRGALRARGEPRGRCHGVDSRQAWPGGNRSRRAALAAPTFDFGGSHRHAGTVQPEVHRRHGRRCGLLGPGGRALRHSAKAHLTMMRCTRLGRRL